MKDTATRTVVNPDGSIDPQHKWLCTSPTHYRNILVDMTMRYVSSPGYQFYYNSLPVGQVEAALDSHGI